MSHTLSPAQLLKIIDFPEHKIKVRNKCSRYSIPLICYSAPLTYICMCSVVDATAVVGALIAAAAAAATAAKAVNEEL